MLGKHAPLKRNFVIGNQASYMTKQLRKAIMRRSKLESILKMGLLVIKPNSKIKKFFAANFTRKKVKKYYSDLDLNKIANNKLFWKTIKPGGVL